MSADGHGDGRALRSGRFGPLPVPVTGPNATPARFAGGLVLGTLAAVAVASLGGALLMVAGLAVLPGEVLPEPGPDAPGANLAAVLLVALLSLVFTVPGALALAAAIVVRWLIWRDVPAGLLAILGFFAGYAIWPCLGLLGMIGAPVALPGPGALSDPAFARSLLAASWFSGPAGAAAAFVGARIVLSRVSP